MKKLSSNQAPAPVMSENNLLLHDKPSRPQREHKGRILVKESDQRWCSDGFEFGCDDGEKLRVMFTWTVASVKP